MSTRKILHAADIHLDSPLQKLSSYESAPVEQIRGASRRALENLVRLAIDQQVDLVVIAGDLYDGDWPDQNTGLFFVAQANALVRAGIPLVVIRGNHDAYNKMTMNLRLPSNPDGSEIMLSERDVETRHFDLRGLPVAVHGRSYRKQHENGNLVKEYPQPLSGVFNLGLLHTGLTGLEGHRPYAPCTPQQLADMEYDYWALGHIHKRGEHHLPNAAPVVFSGNVQGRHIRESGAKGCVILELDDRGQLTSTFHPLDVVRWELQTIAADELDHPDQIIDRFETWLSTAIPDVDDRLLVPRVEIVGATPLHGTLMRRLQSVEASLRSVAIQQGMGQVWFENLKLRTTLPQRPDNPRSDNPMLVDDQDVAASGSLSSVTAVVQQLLQQITPPATRRGPAPGELFADDSEPAEVDAAVSPAGTWIDEELSELFPKLPPEFAADKLVDSRDPASVRMWIEQATAELMGRLQTSLPDGTDTTNRHSHA